MSQNRGDYERTITIGEKAFAHIRSHRTAAYPRAYELWYTYVTGHHPALMRAINDLLRKFGRVSQSELDEIYDRFINANRFTAEAERATVRLLSQMETVGDALENAKTKINDYCGTLNGSVGEMDSGVGEDRLRAIIAELMASTRNMSRLNAKLVEQLGDAKTEVAELREALESIRTESQIDPVTTLANRMYFDTALADAVPHAHRTGDFLAILMTDIDHFKKFNDSYGHLTGDQVLRLVAMSIKQNVKGLDTAARFGGEEFAIILPGCELRGAIQVAEQVRKAVMSRELVKRSTGESLGRVTISVGVAQIRRDDTPASLIERADAALYAAKRGGRNRVMAETDPDVPPLRSGGRAA
ncbi:MAG: GGDEF domain-containing protein [Methylocystis sp.]|nr:GGDEF domain-containing protein [Methylocystis sp.]MCA3590831.1 GGDEF domain-containing protein [Methylocystis sp.]